MAQRYIIGIYGGGEGAVSRFGGNARNPNAECFTDFARALAAALRKLGHEVSNDVTGPGRLIAFGVNNLAVDDQVTRVPADMIVFNTEQVAVDGDAKQFANYQYYMERGHVVWDYSESNIETLKKFGLERAVHCPVGYVDAPDSSGWRPAMGPGRFQGPPGGVEDVDVLFYGSLSPLREEILDALDKTELNVKRLFGVFGAERDAWIARSKVVLNLHVWENGIFEIFRVSHLLANKKCVITEAGGRDEMLEQFADRACLNVPRKGIVEVCRLYAMNANARRSACERGHAEFKKVDLVENVRHALEQS